MGNKKITDLPSATAVNAGDKVEIVQGGTSKQVDANLLSGSGLSGLTTNKVLKATSSTTVGDSNITDDGTIVIIESPNALNSIYVSNAISGYGYGSNESGGVDTNDSRTNVTHSIKNTFDAPLHEFNNSVTKGGVEVATVNDIPTVDTTIIDGSTNAVSGNAVFDGLALKRSTTSEMFLGKVNFTSTNPADSTTYFAGEFLTTLQSVAGRSKFQFANNYTVTKVIITLFQGAAGVTSESVSWYIRESNTTDKTITTSMDMSLISQNISKPYVYSGLSLSVTAGLDYETKVVFPAFSTNPTSLSGVIKIYGY